MRESAHTIRDEPMLGPSTLVGGPVFARKNDHPDVTQRWQDNPQAPMFSVEKSDGGSRPCAKKTTISVCRSQSRFATLNWGARGLLLGATRAAMPMVVFFANT